MKPERAQPGTGQRPVLVFQMGKVGSEAIAQSIEPFFRCVHSHTLQDNAGRRVLSRLPEAGGRWTILTGVREPVARNVSGFFQNFTNRDSRWYVGTRDEVRRLSMRRLVEVFLDRPAASHLRATSWFERHLQRYFDLDVYAHPFRPERGFQRYRNERCRVLLIRQEDLGRRGAALIGRFLHLPAGSIRLKQANRSQDKWYATLYREFREARPLPASYVEDLHATRLARQFYSPQELRRSRERWVS